MSDEFNPVAFFLSEKHFLQTPVWGRFQERLGNEVVTGGGTAADGGTYEYLAICEHGRLSSRLYCPYGPTYDTVGALIEALAFLGKEARARGLSFIRVEPHGPLGEAELAKTGLKKARRTVQPQDTIINDVRESATTPESIIAATSTLRRRLYRRGEKEGVVYEVSYDPAQIGHFIDMIHNVSDRTGMHPHPDSYFEKTAEVLFPEKAGGLLLARLEDKPISAIIFYTDGKVMSYAHAANYSEYRKLSPASGLYSFALLHARESGHVLFDAYGVAPVDAPAAHTWSGFTAFKESFGGVRVHYPGTWELPVKKLQYTAYSMLGKFLIKEKG
ncbi:MAG: peptidoglycan bridge formation glycyltransferase FemA/FemB family protein [Clostridiales Family XIII bacterium]|jgi:lipid II:glycine glycyltransferase (peptidoglycan interpeptide bridge formation enzyme)|nr:peptidoglycan bridge formation glycyltransferase FemA/FemB family protein [Clostridiales Family XIII bacterium]